MPRIHITGASGTGTTTLGRALAAELGLAHHDADDFFWMPTDPPFAQKRDAATRTELVESKLSPTGAWVLSGSIVRWEAPRLDAFDLVVFLSVPMDIRMARVRARDREHFGVDRLGPGGDMHTTHTAFLAWAERYDTAGLEQRSRALHEQWLAEIQCSVLRIEGDTTTDERIARIQRILGGA